MVRKQWIGAIGLVSLIMLLVGYKSLTDWIVGPINAPDRANTAGASLPKPENRLADKEYRWEQRLERDSIKPIYDPAFLSAEEAGYQDDELVIGVALNGEAKAYAIGPLNGREMINDTLGGVPILVTW